MTKEQLYQLIKDRGIQIVDLKFVDLPGLWQHFTVPVAEVDDNVWIHGLGFDGSSIRGFQKIEESDMLIVPDVSTAVLDPATEEPTISLICDIVDPLTKKPYSRDPRGIAKKAEAYLKSGGKWDTSYWGPEAEFFIFDDVRFDQNAQEGYYFIDSVEATWNRGRDEGPNLGYKIAHKEGYFPVAPFDTLMDIRTEMVLAMKAVGIDVEAHHHEVATAGQCEIDMRFDTMLNMADKLMMYKYIVKNVARSHGKVATFMPKPLFGDNGSGMHVHQSLWKDGTNTFFDQTGYALTSETCRHYIGGLLKHARALMAFCAPTTNSYKRLVPGYEAPVNLVYSARNRSAVCRIPVISESPKAKRVEFRAPDPMANPYLAFPAMLMAGLDGIENGIDPGAPLERNTYELAPEEAADMRTVPASLPEAVQALEEDHDFLLKGGVFTTDVIEHFVELQKEAIDAVRLRPHPYEFALYFGA
ncbi:MAG: type I glutamate--ammonia ligase [Dehalococcoidia bacterium]